MSNILNLTNDVLINGNCIKGLDLLWENSNPAEAFSAQTIEMDLSDYNLFVIELSRKNNTGHVSLIVITKDINVSAISVYGTNISQREVMFKDNAIVFADAYAGSSVDNTVCIPTTIYGIRMK